MKEQMIHITIDIDIYIVECTYSFLPGRYAYSNGDPGYPDEEDVQIKKIYVVEQDENDPAKFNSILIKDENVIPPKMLERIYDQALWRGREDRIERIK